MQAKGVSCAGYSACVKQNHLKLTYDLKVSTRYLQALRVNLDLLLLPTKATGLRIPAFCVLEQENLS